MRAYHAAMIKAAIFGLAVTLLPLLGTACGGDDDGARSGLDPGATVTSLSPGDLTSLCAWSAETQGGAGTTTECGDHTVTVNDAAACADGFTGKTCTLTVGEFEECIQALRDDPCTAIQSAACGPIIQCALG